MAKATTTTTTSRGAGLVSDEHADAIFRALAAKPRREILALLATGPGGEGCCSTDDVCGCDLVEHLGLTAPTVSHHMRILVDACLVVSEKRGQWVYYRLEPDAIQTIIRELGRLAGCA
jgi:ArsR family transcriptional regulator, arsenate/arsenite/antimonite-responsive transcriptional repressor